MSIKIQPGRVYTEEEINEFSNWVISREKKLINIIYQYRRIAQVFLFWLGMISGISGIAALETNIGFSWLCFILFGAAFVGLISFNKIFPKIEPKL